MGPHRRSFFCAALSHFRCRRDLPGQALGVSERAAWLVVHQGFGKNTEVGRQGISLKAGVVTYLRL